MLELTERLLDLLAGCDEAEVYKRSNTDAGDGVPLEKVDELERQSEEIEPYGTGKKIS